MNILVVGDGKVAQRVALELTALNNQVSILCREKSTVSALQAAGYTGSITEGVPVDFDSLVSAGVEACDAVASCTDDDNTNVMISEIVREYYGIGKLITSISDVAREEVFQSYDLDTICPTRITANAIISALLLEEHHDIQFGNGTLNISTMPVDALMCGQKTDKVKLPDGHAIVGLQHSDGSISLRHNSPLVMNEGDCLLVIRVID